MPGETSISVAKHQARLSLASIQPPRGRKRSAALIATSKRCLPPSCASNVMRASISARPTESTSSSMARKPICVRAARARANLDQDLYVAEGLKTGRAMVKDEDVCLHCGLCAERVRPRVGYAEVLLEMTQAGRGCRTRTPAPARGRHERTGSQHSTTESNVRPSRIQAVNDFVSSSPTSTAQDRHRRTNSLRAHLPHGCPGLPGNIFPSNIQGCRRVRSSRHRARPPWPARRGRSNGRNESADVGKRRRRDRARRLSDVRQHQANRRSKLRAVST